MELEMYTLEQIRILYNPNISQDEFADLLGIQHLRWKRLEKYESKMLASELVKLIKLTGADANKIKL